MKVAIVGSRGIEKFNLKKVMPKGVTAIVSGGARGVDTLAEKYAKKHKLELLVFKPEYDKYPGKIAPLKRNNTIVDNADVVIAIWDGVSRGTKYTMDYAEKQGKLLHVEIVD